MRLFARRFRFAFGLRTLLLLMTCVAAPLSWVANQSAVIRQRRAALCQVCVDWQRWRGSPRGYPYASSTTVVAECDELPWLRMLLGDQHHRLVVLPYEEHDQRTRQFRKLFPETTLRCRAARLTGAD